jgi:HSP20 family molecular chaperone IbpA
MTRSTLFNSPFLLGFDQIEQALERVSKTTPDGYPPYNIEKRADGSVNIALAVAGFLLNELSVTEEDNQLIIRGQQEDDEGRVYLHRGIAARQFQKTFVLADAMEVAGAQLANGLLTITVIRLATATIVNTIEIVDGENEKSKKTQQAKSQ